MMNQMQLFLQNKLFIDCMLKTVAKMTMAEMGYGRKVLWQKRSMAQIARKPSKRANSESVVTSFMLWLSATYVSLHCSIAAVFGVSQKMLSSHLGHRPQYFSAIVHLGHSRFGRGFHYVYN